MRKSSHATGEPKATANEEREGSNRPHLSRRTCALLSWTAVAIMLAFIFCMSAKTGNDLDNHSGIVSIVKNFLVAGATALFGHEVDVSPVGHFTEYLLLGAALANALRFTPWTTFENNATARPAGMLGDFPAPLIALIFSSLYGVSDEFHQIFTRPYGLACRHLRRSHWGRYRMDAFEEAWFTPPIARPETEAY